MYGIPIEETNPWANDRNTLDLYRRRCIGTETEMTCAAQAADILRERVCGAESILDAGCGGGYYYHSLHRRGLRGHYVGIDYTLKMISLAQTEMCHQYGLSTEQFRLQPIATLDEKFDNIICFNVLTNNPHYAYLLERLLMCTKKRFLLRESLGDSLIVRYTPDPYLDEGKRHIRVYHNTYPIHEVVQLMQSCGFSVTNVLDKRTHDLPEMVVDIPHHWRILVAERI